LKKIHWKILELWILVKFGQQAPGYTSLQGKMNSQQKGDQKFEFQLKMEIGLISR
jgi:hypothetical protein